MDEQNDKRSELTEKIDELEALLIEHREPADPGPSRVVHTSSGIPILEDLFEHDEPDDYPELPFDDDEQEDEPTHERLEQIAGDLEQKLTHELDEIVNLLKVNMRESILNELHLLLKSDTLKKTDDDGKDLQPETD
jgi:hypothetical protein